jgi:hypothetical protein
LENKRSLFPEVIFVTFGEIKFLFGVIEITFGETQEARFPIFYRPFFCYMPIIRYICPIKYHNQVDRYDGQSFKRTYHCNGTPRSGAIVPIALIIIFLDSMNIIKI